MSFMVCEGRSKEEQDDKNAGTGSCSKLYLIGHDRVRITS